MHADGLVMVQFLSFRGRDFAMRVIFYSLIVVLVSLWSGVQAASNLDADTQRQLVRLEKKYFARSFDGDSDDSRVGRLEKQILGCTNSGDPEERMKNIISATSSASITGGANQGFSGSVSAPDQDVSETRPARNLPNPTQPDLSSSKEPSGGGSDSYPHVTELERAILQQTYVGQSLPSRLARMETKAFGHASNDPDLSQRTDALEDYAEQKLHKKSPQAEADRPHWRNLPRPPLPAEAAPAPRPRALALPVGPPRLLAALSRLHCLGGHRRQAPLARHPRTAQLRAQRNPARIEIHPHRTLLASARRRFPVAGAHTPRRRAAAVLTTDHRRDGIHRRPLAHVIAQQ